MNSEKNKQTKQNLTLMFFGLALIFMFISGCAQTVPEQRTSVGNEQQQSADETDTQTEEDSASSESQQRPVDEEEPEEIETKPVVNKKMDKKVAALLQKHVGRVQNLKYMYQDPINKPEEWETWVKGDKIHIKLREMDNVEEEIYIDNVYLDLSKEEAKGYCERRAYRCKDPNTPVDVSFKKYVRKTPLDWIKEVTYAEKVEEEQRQQRNVWKVKYETEDGETIYMWLDEYYGVPLQIKIVRPGLVKDIIFEDIGFNAVDDDDLEHGYVSSAYRP